MLGVFGWFVTLVLCFCTSGGLGCLFAVDCCVVNAVFGFVGAWIWDRLVWFGLWVWVCIGYRCWSGSCCIEWSVIVGCSLWFLTRFCLDLHLYDSCALDFGLGACGFVYVLIVTFLALDPCCLDVLLLGFCV